MKTLLFVSFGVRKILLLYVKITNFVVTKKKLILPVVTT